MKKISDIIGNEISWIQPDWRKNEFEIRDGEDLIGVISWEKDWLLALAKSADGIWQFKRGGFLHQWITIRAEGQDWDIARFQMNWNGSGSLAIHDGRKLWWGITHSEWKWNRDENIPLISIGTDPDQEKIEGIIKIHSQTESVIAPSLLILLGCYIVALRWNEVLEEALAS